MGKSHFPFQQQMSDLEFVLTNLSDSSWVSQSTRQGRQEGFSLFSKAWTDRRSAQKNTSTPSRAKSYLNILYSVTITLHSHIPVNNSCQTAPAEIPTEWTWNSIQIPPDWRFLIYNLDPRPFYTCLTLLAQGIGRTRNLFRFHIPMVLFSKVCTSASLVVSLKYESTQTR